MRTEAEIKQAMTDYLPLYYAESQIADNVISRDAAEVKRLVDAAYDVLDQMAIGTATWGLTRWEKIFSVTPSPNQTYEQRREVLRGKLRGGGKVNAELIKNVAESYGNGEVDVTIDAAVYTIVIQFVSVIGVPRQMDLLKQTLRDVVPAHLAMSFSLRYLLIKEIHGVMKLKDINTHKLSDFAGGVV